MRSHRTTVALNRASFVLVLFHMRLFLQQFTNHILFYRSREFFVALARAPKERALGSETVNMKL